MLSVIKKPFLGGGGESQKIILKMVQFKKVNTSQMAKNMVLLNKTIPTDIMAIVN